MPRNAWKSQSGEERASNWKDQCPTAEEGPDRLGHGSTGITSTGPILAEAVENGMVERDGAGLDF